MSLRDVSLREHLAPAAILLAGVAVVLLPTGTGAIGHPIGDMADHYWGTWWWGEELLSGRLPLTTTVSHHPHSLSLWYIDPIGAFLGLLLRPLGFPAAWNGLVILQVLFAGLATYAAVFDLVRSKSAAVAAGLLLVGSPYLVALLHSGLSEYIGLGWLALYTWALVRTFGRDPQGREPLKRGGLICGALLAACTLQAFYYGAFGGLLAVCFVPGIGWRGRIRPMVVLTGVFALLTAPWMVPLYEFIRSGDAAVGDHNAPGWTYSHLPAVDVLTFFRPGNYYFPDTISEGNPGVLQVSYLGWILLGMAGLGIVRHARTMLVPTALYFVLALGPRLVIGGTSVMLSEGSPLRLPLALMYAEGSPFRLVHHPYRMTAFLILLLLIPAATVLARMPGRWRVGLVGLALVESLLISPAPWPLANTDISAPTLAIPDGPRLDWPADATTWNRRYLLWQVEHGQPTPYGVNLFLCDDLRRDPLIVSLMRDFEQPSLRARNRDVPFTGEVVLKADTDDSALNAHGLQWFVLHKAALSDLERKQAMTALGRAYGQPHSEDAQLAVWEIKATTVRDRVPGASRRRRMEEQE